MVVIIDKNPQHLFPQIIRILVERLDSSGKSSSFGNMKLTQRKQQVFAAIARGLSNKKEAEGNRYTAVRGTTAAKL